LLLWTLLASDRIRMGEINGWEILSRPIMPIALDPAA